MVICTARVGKHLVDLDEAALAAAGVELGMASIKGTVNEALRRVASPYRHRAGNL